MSAQGKARGGNLPPARLSRRCCLQASAGRRALPGRERLPEHLPGEGRGEELKGNMGLTFLIRRLRPARGCLLLISRLSALAGPPPEAAGLRVPPAALPLRARMQPRRGTSGVRGAPAPRSSPALRRSGAGWLLLGAVTSAGAFSGSVGSSVDAWI